MADHFPEGAEAHGAPPRNLLQVFWQRKLLVLFGLAAGALAGTLVYLQRPPVYQSSAQVHVVKKRNDFVQSPDGMMLAYDDFIPTHLVLIRSPMVVAKAVQLGRLGQLPSFAGQADPTKAICAALTATRDNPEANAASTGIINLSFRGPVPEDCPVVLSAVFEGYEAYLKEVSRNTAEETFKQVTEAKQILEKELQEKERERLRLRSTGPLIFGEKDGATFHLARLTALDGKRTALHLRRVELEYRLRAIEAARAAGRVPERLLAAVTPAPEKTTTERSLEEQLLPLIQQEQTLMEDYGDDYPKLKAVRRQIAMTRDLYQHRAVPGAGLPGPDDAAAPERVVAFLRALGQEVKELKETEAELGRLFAEEEADARVALRHLNEDQALSNVIRRGQQNFDLADQRLREIIMARKLDVSGGYATSVITPPDPGGKVAPSLSQVLSAWVFLGLLGGVGLAYLAEVTDKSFRTPEEIRRRLGLPIVGHIPFVPRPAAAAANGAAGLDASLCTHHRPSAVEAEAYRSLRTALYFSTRGERHKVIQVTSPNMGDGKSTLAANLAVCIAQSGKSVVLVDADCRRPRLHRLFGLRGEVGLTSVIAGEAGPAEAVQATGVPHLSVLACGPRPSNPAELLTSPKFEELLNELRGLYDFVLVDSPPLLAVTDPCVVAARADGVLLTIRVSKNGRPAAERAKEMLAALGANVLGVVVNGIGKEAGAYGYSYKHYRYDQYGYEYKGHGGEADPVVEAVKNGQASAEGAPQH